MPNAIGGNDVSRMFLTRPMPYTRQFDFPGAPRDSRPWRNWHPYIATPMVILGSFSVVAPDPFVLSFLTGGLAILLWWLSCFVTRDPLVRILWWLTQSLALLTLLFWGIVFVREIRSGL
jgi:energy-coupling factor transporter transmembrane protein EcfT